MLFDNLKRILSQAKSSVQPKESKPIRMVLVPKDINDKYSDYPSEGLTPVRLSAIFHAADTGDVRAQMELFEEIEEKDTHVASQMQTRKLAVMGLDWEIQTAGDTELDKEIADFVETQITHIFNLEDNPVFDMLDAIGKGISVSEIVWSVEDGKNIIQDVRYIHPKKLVWNPETDEMQICTRAYPTGISLPKNKFVVHRYKARSGHTSRAGLLRSVAWMYLFKNFTIKDWVTFAEIYGMPVRIGKYAESASEEDKEALMQALVNIGTDAAGIIAQACEIEIRDNNKTATSDLYEKLARYCDEQNSKAIVGQTLTADSGGGSYAQGKVHGEVRQDLVRADARALEKTINRDVIRPLVLFNYGTHVAPPEIKYNTEDDEDLKLAAEIYRTLINDIGLPVSEEHVREKFNIPQPKADETLLQSQTPKGYPPLALKALKTQELPEGQKIIDASVSRMMDMADTYFRQIAEPLYKIIGKTDTLEELQLKLQDQETLNTLLEEMDSMDGADALQYALYMSELVGRGQDI